MASSHSRHGVSKGSDSRGHTRRCPWRAGGLPLVSAQRETDMDQPAYLLHRGDALDAYQHWPAPVAIISDGAYGVRGFHGDTVGTGGLAMWYRPHVQAWSQHATPATTLWFWNTEVGWATVHPLIAASGWEYVQVITWDKGVAHIAGNVKGKTIRRFPVVTEICAIYQRRFEVC